MLKRKEEGTLVKQLNDQIEALEIKLKKSLADNNILRQEINGYKEKIKKIEKTKDEYFSSIEECRKLANQYRQAIKDAQETKTRYTKQMQQELKEFRKASKRALK